MYIDMGERIAGKQDRPSLIIEWPSCSFGVKSISKCSWGLEAYIYKCLGVQFTDLG